MPTFADSTQQNIIQVAQQQQITRSDVATTKRAFQDLKDKAEKLSNTVFQIAASAQTCNKDAFEEAWKHRQELNEVNSELSKLEEKMAACMPSTSTARLSEKEKNEIRGLYATGLYTQQQLADQYGVTQPTIGDIVRGYELTKNG
ncbi:hypothetical protein U737_12225 [Methylomonas sp. LW13]|uniref:hypothetical protein n=1 Tax=unclassified Methylomonas TaxID=2608980 RepID=UPI00051B6211|nr:hypothetical protein [Methylomonas sp. LW13]QBC27607.1 hypothetical protein U737_12225 [Methylomonas sp. LW13]